MAGTGTACLLARYDHIFDHPKQNVVNNLENCFSTYVCMYVCMYVCIYIYIYIYIHIYIYIYTVYTTCFLRISQCLGFPSMNHMVVTHMVGPAHPRMAPRCQRLPRDGERGACGRTAGCAAAPGSDPSHTSCGEPITNHHESPHIFNHLYLWSYIINHIYIYIYIYIWSDILLQYTCLRSTQYISVNYILPSCITEIDMLPMPPTRVRKQVCHTWVGRVKFWSSQSVPCIPGWPL